MATEETRTTDGYGCAAVICTAVVTETKSIRQSFAAFTSSRFVEYLLAEELDY